MKGRAIVIVVLWLIALYIRMHADRTPLEDLIENYKSRERIIISQLNDLRIRSQQVSRKVRLSTTEYNTTRDADEMISSIPLIHGRIKCSLTRPGDSITLLKILHPQS